MLMNTDECDIGQETLSLKEYSEETMSAWRNPQAMEASDRKRTSALKIVLSPAFAEAGDKARIIRSTTFPLCP
jgi:hypothetical protein